MLARRKGRFLNTHDIIIGFTHRRLCPWISSLFYSSRLAWPWIVSPFPSALAALRLKGFPHLLPHLFSFWLVPGRHDLFGLAGGSTIAHLISNFDHWIAFGLLAFVGARMIRESLSKNEEDDPCNPSRGKTLVMLSIATSIDALAVGLSLLLWMALF